MMLLNTCCWFGERLGGSHPHTWWGWVLFIIAWLLLSAAMIGAAFRKRQ